MFSSIYTKTKLLLCFSLFFLSFSSCQKNDSDELKTFNSFLETDYAFNTIVLNKLQADYFKARSERPRMNSEQLNTIDLHYEQLISKIDHATTSKEATIESLVQEYNQLLTSLKNMLAPFYKKQLDQYILTVNGMKFSNEYRLKMMKNSLTRSMIYGYQSFNGNLIVGGGFWKVRVKTMLDQHENQVKITLTSNFIQTMKEKKDIKVDQVIFNGVDQKIKYNITENHDFTDIILDSLKPGTYKIEGSVLFFDRSGKKDIPFRETFEVN